MNAAVSQSSQGTAGPVMGTRQFLSFRVGAEEYAIDILAVQEIRGHTAITALPQTPPWVRGAMNLRGVIVPVFDMQQRFGGGPVEYTRFSVIIVVSVGGRQVGLLVDAVNDVVDLAPGAIEPPPDVGASGSPSFVQGLGRHGERLLILLDLHHVMA
jgi:purine-binding chemotaxis protein CheW